MAVKKIEHADIGTVTLSKRRGSRNIRLSISHAGDVRVSLPYWVPYRAGLEFIEHKLDWIKSQRPSRQLLKQDDAIGKAHHIAFEQGNGQSISTRLSGNLVRVLLPSGLAWDGAAAQKAAQSASIRALKKEANQLLPQRLDYLAQQHGFDYTKVSIKQLSGRWGSCNQQREIVLNCFLMRLPWELIDYVLLHELTHTKVMAHGPAFWTEMAKCLPDVQRLRKLIKTHKPIL